MDSIKEAASTWTQDAKRNSGWLIVLGVVTVITGVLAVGSPLASGLTVTVIIGIAMTIGGVSRIIGAFSAGTFGQGALAFIGGILTFGSGLILAGRPGIGLASLTLLLGAYLLVDGISSAILAFRVRPEMGWGWMLFSGAMGVVLGFLLLREWPLSGQWAIGTLVGINLIFSGFSIISVASGVRSLATRLA
ncbi:MAG TPA: HdeD family acid-resistance protein [Vicinamibacterales bacterium]|nr:HdeD family acid-resistance protein [Vicinamibacterales bacterium]